MRFVDRNNLNIDCITILILCLFAVYFWCLVLCLLLFSPNLTGVSFLWLIVCLWFEHFIMCVCVLCVCFAFFKLERRGFATADCMRKHSKPNSFNSGFPFSTAVQVVSHFFLEKLKYKHTFKIYVTKIDSITKHVNTEKFFSACVRNVHSQCTL